MDCVRFGDCDGGFRGWRVGREEGGEGKGTRMRLGMYINLRNKFISFGEKKGDEKKGGRGSQYCCIVANVID